jgi:thiol-disulfide isomerase/thioredoxin
MTSSREDLEDRLRRVLRQAASELPVKTPSPPRDAAAARTTEAGSRRARRDWLPSAGGAVAVIAVLFAAGLAAGTIALLAHRAPVTRHATQISRPVRGEGIVGSKPALLARLLSLRLHGRPVVITVWASWCPPCRSQLRLAAAAARRYGRRIAFLGVDTQDTRRNARSFLRTHPVSFASYESTANLRPILAPALAEIPTTIFISRKGGVVVVHRGEYGSLAALEQGIAAVLRARAPGPPPLVARWPGAPQAQLGAWRGGAAGVCPLAPPNPHLPARAGCVSVAYADVDGHGLTDLILLYGVLGTSRVPGGYVPARFVLDVMRANAATLRTTIRSPEADPTVLGARNVNDRPGVELFVREAAISSGQTVGVYTFDGTALVHAGDFTNGGDSATVQGFSCRLGHPDTITQRVYVLVGPTRSGLWLRTDTTYAWAGAHLRRTARHTTETHGVPPGGQGRADCLS